MALYRIRPNVGDPPSGDHEAERDQREAEFSDDYDSWAARRSGPTTVVVLEPPAVEAGR